MFNLPYKKLISAPKTPLKFLLAASKGYYLVLTCTAILSFLLSLTKNSTVLVFAAMIDYFSRTGTDDFLWKKAFCYLGGILMLFLATNGFRFIRELSDEAVRNIVVRRVKEYALTYAAGHSTAYIKEQKSGQLAQRIIALGDVCWGQLLNFSRVTSCFWLVAITLFFIGRANLCFLLPVVGFGAVSIALSYKISQKTTILNKQSASAYAQYSGEMNDSLSNILLIKIFGQEKSEINKLAGDLTVANKAEISAVKNEAFLHGIQQCFLLSFRITSVSLALYLWKISLIRVADVVLVLLLLDDILNHFSRFLFDITMMRTNFGKLADALKFLQEPHNICDIPHAKKLKVKKGRIDFQNVCFGYTPQQKIFNRFNLSVTAGEKVGIVGKSGSGKSTLINLLQRSYDIPDGQILIDGQNIHGVTQHSLKNSLAIISQESSLFHRSIRRNISFGSPEATDRQIHLAAQKASADEFIQATEHSYLSLTGERGVKLSGGQRQRIAIARAILKKSPILILDEATSALDNKTENEVISAINELIQGKTVIAIAHRLSTLQKMDRIIVMEKGKIIEDDSPEKLLDKHGKFARLWKLQQH